MMRHLPTLALLGALSLGGTQVIAENTQKPAPGSPNQEQINPPGDRPEFGRRGQFGGQRGDGLPMLKSLNLTNQQQAQLKAIRDQYEPQRQTLEEQLRTGHDKMRDLMTGNASDEEIRAQHRQMQQLQSQMADQRLESMLAMRKVLTPEQRSQLGQMMDDRRDQMRDRMEQWQEKRKQKGQDQPYPGMGGMMRPNDGDNDSRPPGPPPF